MDYETPLTFNTPKPPEKRSTPPVTRPAKPSAAITWQEAPHCAEARGGAFAAHCMLPQGHQGPHSYSDLRRYQYRFLRTDGPTLEEFVEAHCWPEDYPPFEYAEKDSPMLRAYRAALKSETLSETLTRGHGRTRWTRPDEKARILAALNSIGRR